MAIGIAVTTMVTQPATIPELILAVGGGAFGALISDIDVKTSDSRRSADKIILLTSLIVAGIFTLDYFFHAGIIDKIIRNSGYERIIMGTLLFIGICAYGKEQPHRSFMHSFLALALLSFAISLIWGKAVIYFAPGFLSHLAIDIFNKRKVQLLYPLKDGVALRICHANGFLNHIFFRVGTVFAVINITISIMRIISI